MKASVTYLTRNAIYFLLFAMPIFGYSGIPSITPLTITNQGTYMVVSTGSQAQVPGKKLFDKGAGEFSVMQHTVAGFSNNRNAANGPSGLALAGLAACFFILFLFGIILGPMGVTLFRITPSLPAKPASSER